MSRLFVTCNPDITKMILAGMSSFNPLWKIQNKTVMTDINHVSKGTDMDERGILGKVRYSCDDREIKRVGVVKE